MSENYIDLATEFLIPTHPSICSILVSKTGPWEDPQWIISYNMGGLGWVLTRDRRWLACGDLNEQNIAPVSHPDRDKAIKLALGFAARRDVPNSPWRDS